MADNCLKRMRHSSAKTDTEATKMMVNVQNALQATAGESTLECTAKNKIISPRNSGEQFTTLT